MTAAQQLDDVRVREAGPNRRFLDESLLDVRSVHVESLEVCVWGSDSDCGLPGLSIGSFEPYSS